MESSRRSSLDLQPEEQCKSSEEVEAQRWMDRASRYVAEGRFESAIRLLEKTENVFPGCKNLPELMAVTQVSYAATWRSCHCARQHTRKLPDWYHVLKVDERADFETIKKRYRQLALLLHPDKNKHVSSEAAFKIITEAYTCLSDKEKRDLFNLERRRSFCANCSLKAQLHAAGHSVHSAGHTPGPGTRVRTPRAPKPSTPKHGESDSLQSLRERAKSTVHNLEREWGTKTSKWMQQLANVRLRYWNLSTTSPPGSRAPKAKARSHTDSEGRRASNGGETLQEDLDLLLKKLREAERRSSKSSSPLFKEFVVQTRTPEAGHLARPLFVRRSSSVDRKCSLTDAGPTYAMCMPRGRCVTKKEPFSPSVLKPPSAAVARKPSAEPKSTDVPAKEAYSATPGRSSSLRFENVKEPGPRSVARTASGSWTSRVKANPELFDDVFTTVSSSALRTPIRRQTPTAEAFALRTPPGNDRVAKLLADAGRKMAQRETPERKVSERYASLSARLQSHSNPSDVIGRSERMSSFRMNSTCTVERGRDVKLEDMEQKQKTEAINGILERLRAEAKTVAASLDRLRENIAVEARA